MSQSRFHSLDAIRGLASLQVLISHSLVAIPFLVPLVYNDPQQTHNAQYFLTNSPIGILWSDSAAVKVFFVLSGFVLSIPYYKESKNDPNYPNFFLKRIIRLYLPCLAIIIISLILKIILYKPNEIKEMGIWVQQMWTLDLDSKKLFNLLILNGSLDYFDRALWTLPAEIKLSLILPFTIYIIRRMNKFCSLISVVIYIGIWHLLNKAGAKNIWPDYPVLYFFSFFIIGSVVCKYRQIVTQFINNITLFSYCLFIVIAILLYTYKYSFAYLPIQLYATTNSLNDYISAIAAVMVLSIALSERAQKILGSKPLVFLGKISFSLYLIHIVVITVFAYLFQHVLNPLGIVAVAFLSSFPLAVAFYHFIEIPSLNFANRFGKKLMNMKQ